MKRYIFAVLALMLSLNGISAQDIEPTTTWPYIYSDFQSGELKQLTGAPVQGAFNIHILEGRLHFIEDGMIREMRSSEVVSVKVGDDYFANVSGKMMKVLAKSDAGFIAEEVLVDVARLNATGGAYGSSSNSIATQALSSLEGIGGTRSNMNHMELKNAKNEGTVLPIIVKKYLVFPGYLVYATKADVSKLLSGADKDELNAFLKENKIKWKDENSLIKVLDFVSEKLTRW
jgi:hypothetical protein